MRCMVIYGRVCPGGIIVWAVGVSGYMPAYPMEILSVTISSTTVTLANPETLISTTGSTPIPYGGIGILWGNICPGGSSGVLWPFLG